MGAVEVERRHAGQTGVSFAAGGDETPLPNYTTRSRELSLPTFGGEHNFAEVTIEFFVHF
jgi:hypothetical protein